MLEIFIIALATLLGVITQRVVGFGIGAFVTPIVLIFFEPAPTVVIALLVGTLSCAAIVFDARRRFVLLWPVIFRLLIPSVLGLLLGAYIVTRIDKALLQVVVGIVVIVGILIQQYAFPKPKRALGASRGITLSGFLGGLFNSGAGNGVPPIILWIRRHTSTPEQIRQNLAALFIPMNICSMVTIYVLQPTGFSNQAVTTSLLLVPIIVIGSLIGNRLTKKVNTRQYEKLMVITIILTGIVTAALGLAHYV